MVGPSVSPKGNYSGGSRCPNDQETPGNESFARILLPGNLSANHECDAEVSLHFQSPPQDSIFISSIFVPVDNSA